MFESTCIIEIGLPDFDIMLVTVIRKTFEKVNPTVIKNRSCRDCSDETFRVSLINNSSNEVFLHNDDDLEKFCKTIMDTLNSVPPIKKKCALDSQILFMTKALSKKIMTSLRLRDKYLKHKTEDYFPFYTLLGKTEINYHDNLDERDIADNKKVWKTVKPLLSYLINQ